jgi:hypothetical protein
MREVKSIIRKGHMHLDDRLTAPHMVCVEAEHHRLPVR